MPSEVVDEGPFAVGCMPVAAPHEDALPVCDAKDVALHEVRVARGERCGRWLALADVCVRCAANQALLGLCSVARRVDHTTGRDRDVRPGDGGCLVGCDRACPRVPK